MQYDGRVKGAAWIARFVAPLVASAVVSFGCDAARSVTRAPEGETPIAEDPGIGDDGALSVSEDACAGPDAQLRPFVVAWSEDQLTGMVSRAPERIAAVRLEGCRLELLAGCELPGAYVFRETSVKNRRVVLDSPESISATLPFAQLALRDEARRSDRLALEYDVRGVHHASRPAVFTQELGEGCEGATHFVLNFSTGAFRLDRHAARASRDQGATSDLDAESVLLASGDVSGCPDDQCSSPVRVRLVPINEGAPGEADTAAANLATADLTPGRGSKGVETSTIRDVVRYARTALAGCVRSHTVEGEAPVGKITYDFTITPHGTVSGAAPDVVGSLPPDFVECVTDVAYSLRFPRSSTVQRVRYPFEFRASP